MTRTIGRTLAAALALALVLVPASAALAVDPPQTPQVFMSESFSDPYPDYLDVSMYQIPGDPPTNAWWGRVGAAGNPGTGLWCAGVGGTWGSNYPVRTRGTATFDASRTAGYYSSEVSFHYAMPTKGVSDLFFTRWAEDAYSPSPDFDVHTEALSSDWKLQSYDLASPANDVNLSRTSGDVQFFFFDFSEPSGVTPTVGRGPRIDNVTLAGFKYGPVRNLDSVQAGGEVHLDWLKPYRATGSTTVEERPVEYRVWRAPGTGPSYTWTELTSSRISATDYVDDTAVGGQTYTYLVQAWDEAAGTGYGEVATVEQLVTSVLQVEVKPNKPNIVPGEQVTFDYEVRNVGVADATDVTVTDSFGNSFGPFTILAGKLWVTQVNKQINVTTTNNVTASGTYQGGSVAGMGSATVTVRIPDISLTVTAADTSLPYGGTARLTYKAKNTGNTTLTNVRVTDPLVGTFTLASSLAPGATASTTKTKTLYADATSDAEVTASSSYGSTSDAATPIAIDVAPEPTEPPIADEYTPVPVEGATRYGTAIEASKDAFPDGAETVIITTGQNWPDALGGSALAGAYDGPILLTPATALPAEVLTEIERLGASQAVILGGPGAVSPTVESALASKLGATSVTRIGGSDRYVTAELIARAVASKLGDGYDGTAFVATGANFPDALGGSPLAAAGPWPIFLSTPAGLTASTASTMDAIGVDEVLILGGIGVVSPATESGLANALGSGNVTRLAGSDRYATAVAVATHGVGSAGLKWDGFALSTGENFPDALAGGVLQGKMGSVMMLTHAASLTPATGAAISAHKNEIATVRYLGGPGAVSQAVRTSVAAILQ